MIRITCHSSYPTFLIRWTRKTSLSIVWKAWTKNGTFWNPISTVLHTVIWVMEIISLSSASWRETGNHPTVLIFWISGFFHRGTIRYGQKPSISYCCSVLSHGQSTFSALKTAWKQNAGKKKKYWNSPVRKWHSSPTYPMSWRHLSAGS